MRLVKEHIVEHFVATWTDRLMTVRAPGRGFGRLVEELMGNEAPIFRSAQTRVGRKWVVELWAAGWNAVRLPEVERAFGKFQVEYTSGDRQSLEMAVRAVLVAVNTVLLHKSK